MPSNFRNQNIYAFNVLKSLDADFDKSYSYLFSTLLNLESELEYGSTSLTQFAEHLLTTVNQSKAFRPLDRVCLAITHPGSSRLSVLSSFNTNRLEQNTMHPSYSCFVSRNSSIFNTQKSNIRTYSDINNIVAVYHGKPVQRSLARLQKMGVKSGLTIPLSISNLVSGLLFLNSADTDHFSDLRAPDYSALCLIKLIALSCLKKALFGINGLDDNLGKLLTNGDQSTNTFSAEEFAIKLSSVIESRFNKKVSLKVNNTIGNKFFYALNPAVYTLVKAIEHLADIPNEIAIDVTQKDQHGTSCVEVKTSNLQVSAEQLLHIQDLKLFTNQEIGATNGNFFMRSPLEFSEAVDYSV